MIPGIDPDSIVYLNGDFVRLGEAKISVLDRGFIYGDGIYDVVPAYRGKPFRMDGHLNRLERSLAKVGIANPFTRLGWEKLVLDMLARSGRGADCMVYIQVTRGVAKREHAFPKDLAPSVFVMVSPFTRVQAERDNGLSAIAIDDIRWLHCDIKSVSLLGNVLAKQQAVQAGVDEVIQFRDGFLTEGASCNIWIVRDGILLAPMRNNLILEGVRYGLLEELAAQAGIAFQARRISREEVDTADEILMTAATKEVLPIVVFNGQPVGDGRPGPVYATLREGYDKAIQATEQA